MSSSKLKNALPGFIPLYVGMPIVLKHNNIFTELGITNSAQGYICDFDIKHTSSGHHHSTCILMHFPDSNINLPHLPDKCFPIVPVKTTFTKQLFSDTGTKITVKITRTQMPIQPAFAITGHSTQGKMSN
jgi:hypothetical protein